MLLKQIQELKKSIIEQANKVEKMIQLSMAGLLERDEKKLAEVFDLEDEINKRELEIEEEATTLIALQKPEAKNLRIILMIIAMNNDLERMGDLAVNITKRAQYLIQKPFIKKLINIPSMAEETLKMLKNTITAFVDENVVLAKQVCIDDDIVDDLKEQIYRVLITYMMDNPGNIKRAFNINNISQNLERIADLSTNIAEETIYMAEGTVIKHKTDIEE
ncbi:MAG: phosphate signaling complex protein PhoU [Candidatus Cloacimonetes bacterium]|nr:phosphate signaling complex protein PhoU [Candidatus Cloacimonadota bacterium]MCF7814031.1 phosphate signaling complex protein PhoU [Candidatus Cloacimonadota bacterium]MCF7868065.1 phosphate signaling complex protein PhoU [Candidatus Cloacimonadota bacterium]MCF7883488.1 phosphate signaling complex protein PhoU [Candidatus Cloacimonadota bacterium]